MKKYSIIFTLVFLLISTAYINYNLSKIKYVKARLVFIIHGLSSLDFILSCS